MKKKLIIHIGRPKVGSSALQYFLHVNQAVLAENGYLYPQSARYQRASHKLSLSLLPNLPDYKVVSDTTPVALYEQVLDELRGGAVNTGIISSEHFWLVNPKKVAALISDDIEVRILAYVRRQDDVLASSYLQELKQGQIPYGYDFLEYASDKNRLALMDYDQILGRWSKAFPASDIAVRVYENIEQRNIERDILKFLGIKNTDGFRFSEARKNTSPASDMLPYIDQIRKMPIEANVKQGVIGALSQLSDMVETDERYDASKLFSLAERQQVMSGFAESNKKMLDIYFQGDPAGAFPVLDSARFSEPAITEMSQERFKLAVAAVFLNQQKTIRTQQLLMGDLIKRVDALEQGVSYSQAPSSVYHNPKPNAGFLSTLALRIRNALSG